MRREVKVVFLVLLVFAVVSLTFSQQTASLTRHVNGTDPTCLNHSPCYATIQAAVTAAQSGDTIHI